MTMLNVLCVRRPGGSAGFRRLDSDLLLDLCGASLLFFPSPDTSHCHIQSLTRRKYFKCHQLKMKLWKVTVINSWSLLGWFNRFRGKKWRIKPVMMNSVFVAAASGFIWSYWMTSGTSHLLRSPAARVPPDFLMWWFDGCTLRVCFAIWIW